METTSDPVIAAIVRATQQLRDALDAHAAALEASRGRRDGFIRWRPEGRAEVTR